MYSFPISAYTKFNPIKSISKKIKLTSDIPVALMISNCGSSLVSKKSNKDIHVPPVNRISSSSSCFAESKRLKTEYCFRSFKYARVIIRAPCVLVGLERPCCQRIHQSIYTLRISLGYQNNSIIIQSSLNVFSHSLISVVSWVSVKNGKMTQNVGLMRSWPTNQAIKMNQKIINLQFEL